MDRRTFVKGGAMALAAPLKDSKGESPELSVLPVRGESSPPRVLFHCHCFPANPDRFPSDPDSGEFPGSPVHLAAFALEQGFDLAVALSPFEAPEGRCTARIDEGRDGPGWLLDKAADFPALKLFASLDPSRRDSPARLAEAARKGFSGIKLHPPICRFEIDPSAHAEFYRLAADLGLPVLIHTGVFGSGEPWPLEAYSPERIDRLACAHPDLSLILAHGGGAALCRQVLALVQSRPNVYLDLTHTLQDKYAWYIPDSDFELILKHAGARKLIYGADYPWYGAADLGRDMSRLRSLGLGESELELALGSNYLRLAGQRQAKNRGGN